jgi:hypothetical protein
MNNQDHDNIYGNPDEEMEFRPVQNPYYGGEVEMDNPRQNNVVDLNNTEIVTTTRNLYYEM